MNGFKIFVKGVYYDLHPYKELRGEWDLVVDNKMICDSKPYNICLEKFISLIKDSSDEVSSNFSERYL